MQFKDLPVRAVEPFRTSDTFRMAADILAERPDETLKAVVDAESRVVGAISRSFLLAKASGKFGRALFDNRPITDFLEPHAYLAKPHQAVSDVDAHLHDPSVTTTPEGYIITGPDNHYVGIVKGLDVFRSLIQQNTRLIASLNAEVEVRRTAEREAQRLADTDMLTGLANRRIFIRRLDELIGQGAPCVLLFIDLDRFKHLNDKFGHAVGDDVLKTVSQRLLAWRADTLVARLGGDEFALVLPEAQINDELAAELAMLHKAVCAPLVSKPGTVNVGASIGAAAYPANAHSRGDLLHAADTAMSRAKADRSGVAVFDPERDLAHHKQTRLAATLHGAVASDLFEPFFQPFIAMKTGQIVGHEVLARWKGPDIGFRPMPAEFIPLAERMGLIDDVFWALAAKALRKLAAQEGNSRLALNVSPIQCRSRDFPERLSQMAGRHGIAADRIEIEITETSMFRDMAETIEVLHILHARGVGIALDDFGTGYSSLSLLRDLPITKLKIDRSFVLTAGSCPNAGKIAAAAVSLSKALGIECCAEGVETSSHFAYLQELGCEYGQGYLIGRPQPDLSSSDITQLRRAV